MRRFLNLIRKKEIRYLLIDEFWPDDYFDLELFSIYPEIMNEYEKLSGDNVYESAIQNEGIKKDQDLILEQMKGIRILFQSNKELALETINKISLKYSSFEEIDHAIKQREFSNKVREIREGQTKQKERTFEEMCIPIEEMFKITIDQNITVAKFRAWENRFKEKIKKSA